MTSITVESCTFALFGALGDLALRKLFPALYQLDRAGLLHADTRIFALARENGEAHQHLASIGEHLLRHVPAREVDQAVLQRFMTQIPQRLNVASEKRVVFNAILVEVDEMSGHAVSIERLQKVVDV